MKKQKLFDQAGETILGIRLFTACFLLCFSMGKEMHCDELNISFSSRTFEFIQVEISGMERFSLQIPYRWDHQ